MSIENLTPSELWSHREFIAGHTTGAAHWNAIKPGQENPKPANPYSDPTQRALWDRGFDWGEHDAEAAYYQTD